MNTIDVNRLSSRVSLNDMEQTMKRWAYSALPGRIEDNLTLLEHQLPQHLTQPPKGKQLVQVLTMSLNPVDYKLPESPIESRVVNLRKPATPGMDFCGRLINEDRIVVGRLAWPDQYGTLGNYILVSDHEYTDLPKTCSVEQGATLGIGPLTAYQSIVPYAKAGDRVVIFGGSGGVGAFSIQIAKLLGCHVVVTCSGRNTAFCQELGADEVIDYTKDDVVTQLSKSPPFDLAVDNVGHDPTLHKRFAPRLRSTGQFIVVSGMLGSLSGILSMAESAIRPTWLGGSRGKWKLMLCQANKKDLQQIASWIDAGKLRINVETVYSFQDAPKAFSKLREGRTRGKIVVKVADIGGSKP